MKSNETTICALLFALLLISCNTRNNENVLLDEPTEQNLVKDSLGLITKNVPIVDGYIENMDSDLGVTVAELDSIVDNLSVQDSEAAMMVDLDYGTHLIKTDLLIAAFNNDKYYLVDKLIKEYEYIARIGDSIKMVLLFNAVRRKSLKYVEEVVESGADLNYCFRGEFEINGIVDLLIKEEDDKILSYLLSKGLSPKGCTDMEYVEYHFPPLAKAIMRQNSGMVRLLIEYGADLEVRYSDSAEDCWPCPENITPIHELGVDWYQNDSIKHSVAEYVLRKYVLTDSPKKVEILSDVLNYSSYSQDTAILEMLIDRGAKIEFEGNSSLLSAATFSNWTMVRKLLQNGADPNFFLKNQGTPAHVSLTCCGDGFGDGITKFSREQTLRYLKMYGADFKTKYEVEGLGNLSVEDLMKRRGIEID